MKITKQANGTLYENDSDIVQGITLAAGTKCINLEPGESHFEPTVVAPTDETGAVCAIAAAITNGD